MKTKRHYADGASLERIEELASSIEYQVPDWVPYTVAIEGTETSALDEAMVQTSHFSGLLRQLSNSDYISGPAESRMMPDEENKQHDIFEVLDEAAERLDQAHQEWLEARAGQGCSLVMYWGYEFQREEYTFNTEAEKAAFIRGIGAGDGWQKYLSAEEDEEYEVVQRVGAYWENTWHEDDEPQTFPSYTAASRALREHFADADAAKLDYNPDEFNIVPIGHF